jgi:CubicO group peptidase (beta-lactamase class C family)
MRKLFKPAISILVAFTMAFSLAVIVVADVPDQNALYVPLRRIFEYAGGEVTWNQAGRRIEVSHGEDSYVFFMRSREAYKNGESYMLNHRIHVAGNMSFISYYDVSSLFEDESGYLSTTIMAAVISALQVMDLASVTGVTVALVDAESGFTWTQGFGYADTQRGVRVNEQTLFGLASISKTFTAVAVMQLVEAGVIDLDEPIVTYLPEFSTKPDLEGGGDYRKVTARMLLSHASGLYPDFIASGAATSAGYYPGFMDNFLDTLAGFNMLYPEASAFTYANNSFTLLGILVAEMSGRDSYFDGFAGYMQDKVFDPIGMGLTTFALGDPHMPYLALPYANALTREEFIYYNALPAGGIFSNAQDMARFMHMLLSGGIYGGTRVLSRDSVGKMIEIQDFGFEEAPDFLVPNMRPGLGLLHSTGIDGFVHVGHGGNLIHYHSDMAFDLDSGIGVLVSTNSITGAGVERVLSNAILQAAVFEKTGTLKVLPPDYSVSPAVLSREELQAFEGLFVVSGAGEFARVMIGGDGALYVLNFSGIPIALGLMPLSDGSFINLETGLRFWFEDIGGELVIILGDHKTHVLGARLNPEDHVAPEGFERLIGMYAAHVEEGFVSLASHVEIGVDDDGIAYMRLFALHGMTPVSPLTYLGDNTYSSGILIEFRVDGDDVWVVFSGAEFIKRG